MVAVALGRGAAHPGVRRREVRATGRLVVLACCIAACGASRIPVALRGYEILVDRKDPQGAEMARAFRDNGFRVRGAVRGGSRPTAALVFFTFREPGRGTETWLHLRLVDTRSGAIVGAGMVLLDSVRPDAKARADAGVGALLATPLPTPP
jgi:hypothetical protein